VNSDIVACRERDPHFAVYEEFLTRRSKLSAMKPLTRDEVVAALGEVDDAVIAEVVGTGATAEELAEARAWGVNDEPLINTGKPLAAGRIGRLVEILRSIEDEQPGPMGHRIFAG
jgi:hypothetical protein